MRIAAPLMLSMLLGAAAAGQSSQPAATERADAGGESLRLVNTIKLDGVAGRIDHMAMDADAGVLYVAALGNNSVEAVDIKSGEIVARATRTTEPQGIRVLPDGRVAVASGGDSM